MFLCVIFFRSEVDTGEQCGGSLQGNEAREEEPELRQHKAQPPLEPEVIIKHVNHFPFLKIIPVFLFFGGLVRTCMSQVHTVA